MITRYAYVSGLNSRSNRFLLVGKIITETERSHDARTLP